MPLENIIKYATNTPVNTNPAVMSSVISRSFEESSNKIKQDLYESGGIGYTEPGKVYAFDGDASGKVVGGNLVKISDDAPDLKKTTKIVFYNGTETEVSPDIYTFIDEGMQGFTDPHNPDVIFIASIPVGDDEFPAGLYVYCDDELYVSRIEFAETIHPIDPKYLPDVATKADIFGAMEASY